MKTKPNNLYFKAELKKITLEAREQLCTEQLKKHRKIIFSLNLILV